MSADLPDGWTWAQLEDLVAAEPRAITDGPFGSNLKTAHYTDSGPRVIRLQNIGDGVFRHEDAHISKEHYMSLAQHSVQEGDLVVASLGEMLPRACLVPSWVPPAIVKADCIRVRLHPSLDSSYINFALQRPDLRNQTATQIKGVGRPRLGLRGIRNLAVPLAPLSEQERIVAAIEEHFSRLDAVDRSLLAVTSKLRGFHSVLANAAALDWPTVHLGDVAEVFVGSTPSRKRPDLWGGPVPWVSSGEVQFCRIRATRESIATEAVRPDRVHPPGTVLLGMIGEGRTRGQAALLEIAAAHNQNSAAIRTERSRLSPDWLFHVFRAQYEANRGIGSGNNQPALNKTRVRQLTIPLPPLAEQVRLSRQLDETVVALDHASVEVQGAQARCGLLCKAVLADAFAGRLVAQDPDDEPAWVLLERIAASRPMQPKAKA